MVLLFSALGPHWRPLVLNGTRQNFLDLGFAHRYLVDLRSFWIYGSTHHTHQSRVKFSTYMPDKSGINFFEFIKAEWTFLIAVPQTKRSQERLFMLQQIDWILGEFVGLCWLYVVAIDIYWYLLEPLNFKLKRAQSKCDPMYRAIGFFLLQLFSLNCQKEIDWVCISLIQKRKCLAQ